MGIILLILVFAVLSAPLLLDGKLKPKDDWETVFKKEERAFASAPRWTGPKTDERINRMLSECEDLLRGLGVPISESVCPEVTLNGSTSTYGLCCARGSKKRYSAYDYYIEISGYTLENTEKSLRNTLIHELIHTVPGGHCHTGQWKKWADYVSEKTEYTIQHYGGDETPRDEERLRYCGRARWV